MIVSLSNLMLRLHVLECLGTKNIGFTNGVFDIFHVGHLEFLREASLECDFFIVAINSDNSVKRLKGDKRPINLLEDRMEIINALKFVDAVISFDEDDASKLLDEIMPDFYFKGSDYAGIDTPEFKAVKNYGGEVKLLDIKKGYSTTALINKIKNN